MNRGKEAALSLCQRKFLLDAIEECKRLDGREVYDYRSIEVTLGSSPGHVEVKLGDTRVLAFVSCRVIQPRPQRPTEGQLFFNVELSPMASPAFDVGRPSSVATEINRTLERCVKESRAVDTESLCIIAGEKVWEVRVDVHVLDHCGNITDCSVIAVVTALKHFRRPDVTVVGEEATIHPVSEREPVPLSIHHMPLCFTFAFYHGGAYLLVDPSIAEEAVMEGRLMVGMNVHQEICALQMTGGVAIEQEQVIRCTQIAAVKCMELTDIIKKALSEPKTGDVSSILQTKQPKRKMVLPEVDRPAVMEVEEVDSMTKPEVIQLDRGTAELGMGGPNTWELLSTAKKNWSSSEEEMPSEQPQAQNPTKRKSKRGKQTPVEVVGTCSGSEEEETITLTTAEQQEDLIVIDVSTPAQARVAGKKRRKAKNSQNIVTDSKQTPGQRSGKQKKQKK